MLTRIGPMLDGSVFFFLPPPEEKCDHDESVTTRQSWESLLRDILQMVSIISVLVLKTLGVIAALHPLSLSVSG